MRRRSQLNREELSRGAHEELFCFISFHSDISMVNVQEARAPLICEWTLRSQRESFTEKRPRKDDKLPGSPEFAMLAVNS